MQILSFSLFLAKKHKAVGMQGKPKSVPNENFHSIVLYSMYEYFIWILNVLKTFKEENNKLKVYVQINTPCLNF